MTNITTDFNPNSLEELDKIYRLEKTIKPHTLGLEFMFNHPDRLIESKYPKLFRNLCEENQRCQKIVFQYKLFRILLENKHPDNCLHEALDHLPDYIMLALSEMKLNDKVYELSLAMWALTKVLAEMTKGNFNSSIMRFYRLSLNDVSTMSEKDYDKDIYSGLPYQLFIEKCFSKEDFDEISKHMDDFDVSHYII